MEYWLKCLSSIICSMVMQPAEPRECVCECVLPSFTWGARALAGWPALSSFRSIRPTIQKCCCLVVSNVKTLVLSIYTRNLCFAFVINSNQLHLYCLGLNQIVVMNHNSHVMSKWQSWSGHRWVHPKPNKE